MESNNSAATYTRFTGNEELEAGVYTLEDEVTIPNHRSRHHSRLMWCSKNRQILLICFVTFIIFSIGFIAGYMVRRSIRTNGVVGDSSNGNLSTKSPSQGATTMATLTDNEIFKDIKIKMSLELMMENKRLFDNGQHTAGSDWSTKLASSIRSKWSALGFQTTIKNYNVALSRPGKNVVNITGLNLPINLYNSAEGVYTPYSLDKSATGQPIFVNYGRYEDYDVLKHERAYNFQQHSIALARMGKIPLSVMAKIAEENNIKGMIVFADPTDYAPDVSYEAGKESTKNATVFPKKQWLPGNAIVQDSVLTSMGDPFSPGFASGVNQAITLNQTSLPKIPVVSIGYETAYNIISKFESAAAPNWKGSFGKYYVEGGTTQDIVVNIDVDNRLEQTEISNVIAIIPGSVEQDQYVIIGGHRDSVSVGAASPGTGVVCLLEVARLLKFLIYNRKWKPYRSIMLVSWDAGGPGQIGSTEWVEDHLGLLKKSVVAYINLDEAVVGNYVFEASGSPLLAGVIYEASKEVECPNHKKMSVFTDWKNKDKGTENPRLSIPGSGTDDSPFLHIVGVPTISLGFTYDKARRTIDKYPLYNTKLDTSKLVNQYDASLVYHKAIIEVALRVVYEIADKPVLPFSVVNYADEIFSSSQLLNQNSSLDQIVTAAINFKTSAEAFAELVNKSIQDSDTKLYSTLNYKLMSLEKMFLSKMKRPHFDDYRHLLLGPTLQKAYNGIMFPALRDAIDQKNTTLTNSYTLEIVSTLMQASHLLSSQLP